MVFTLSWPLILLENSCMYLYSVTLLTYPTGGIPNSAKSLGLAFSYYLVLSLYKLWTVKVGIVSLEESPTVNFFATSDLDQLLAQNALLKCDLKYFATLIYTFLMKNSVFYFLSSLIGMPCFVHYRNICVKHILC